MRRAVPSLLVTLVLAVGLGVTGCGVTLASQPPELPTPDASEVSRSAAVEQALALAATAEQVAESTDSDSIQELAQEISRGATAHAATLGGEWLAPSWATPSPGETSAPTPPAATGADLHSLLTELVAGAQEARAASATADGDLGRVLQSIALWRLLAAHEVAAQLRDTAGEEALEQVSLPGGGIDLGGFEVATVSGVEDLVRGLDAASFGYEVLAARTEDADRRSDWLRRTQALRTAAESLARTAGLAGTSNDPRSAVYDVAALADLEEGAAVATLESRLATLWSTAPLPAAMRPAAIDAALDSYLRAWVYAPMAALDGPSVVLPGLNAG